MCPISKCKKWSSVLWEFFLFVFLVCCVCVCDSIGSECFVNFYIFFVFVSSFLKTIYAAGSYLFLRAILYSIHIQIECAFWLKQQTVYICNRIQLDSIHSSFHFIFNLIETSFRTIAITIATHNFGSLKCFKYLF